MMGVPVIYLADSAIAHTALWTGVARESLRHAGMCDSVAEAHSLATRLLRDPALAVALSERQGLLRSIYRPEAWDAAPAPMLQSVARTARYERLHRDPEVDRPPPAGLADLVGRLPRRMVAAAGRRLRLPRRARGPAGEDP
jgi:hypothetical protein